MPMTMGIGPGSRQQMFGIVRVSSGSFGQRLMPPMGFGKLTFGSGMQGIHITRG
jgi:hypothetical protein